MSKPKGCNAGNCQTPTMCGEAGFCRVEPDRSPLALPDDLEFRIAKLSLEPGDILVIKMPKLDLSSPDMTHNHRMIEHMKKRAGFDNFVLFMPDDYDLAIITRAEIEEKKI